jgi:hypothetical protein
METPSVIPVILEAREIENRSLTSFSVPSSVTILGSSCFEDCRYLSEVMSVPVSSVMLFNSCAFGSCMSLRSICIPASVAKLRERCFYHCASLSSLTFEWDRNLQE